MRCEGGFIGGFYWEIEDDLGIGFEFRGYDLGGLNCRWLMEGLNIFILIELINSN